MWCDRVSVCSGAHVLVCICVYVHSVSTVCVPLYERLCLGVRVCCISASVQSVVVCVRVRERAYVHPYAVSVSAPLLCVCMSQVNVYMFILTHARPFKVVRRDCIEIKSYQPL